MGGFQHFCPEIIADVKIREVRKKPPKEKEEGRICKSEISFLECENTNMSHLGTYTGL